MQSVGRVPPRWSATTPFQAARCLARARTRTAYFTDIEVTGQRAFAIYVRHGHGGRRARRIKDRLSREPIYFDVRSAAGKDDATVSKSRPVGARDDAKRMLNDITNRIPRRIDVAGDSDPMLWSCSQWQNYRLAVWQSRAELPPLPAQTRCLKIFLQQETATCFPLKKYFKAARLGRQRR